MAGYSKHIYAPKPGDEVKWPNGLVMTYNLDGIIVVTGIPEDQDLRASEWANGSVTLDVTE